jgi:hypothetical protein
MLNTHHKAAFTWHYGQLHAISAAVSSFVMANYRATERCFSLLPLPASDAAISFSVPCASPATLSSCMPAVLLSHHLFALILMPLYAASHSYSCQHVTQELILLYLASPATPASCVPAVLLFQASSFPACQRSGCSPSPSQWAGNLHGTASSRNKQMWSANSSTQQLTSLLLTS